MTEFFGPWRRRLMQIHDSKLRRCWWCGSWAYALTDCNDCSAPAERPDYMDERKTS